MTEDVEKVIDEVFKEFKDDPLAREVSGDYIETAVERVYRDVFETPLSNFP